MSNVEQSESRKIDPNKLEKVAELLKTISHPVRLQIIELLNNNERLSVTEIMEKIPFEQPVVSLHLIKMKDKGILQSEREGKFIYYRLLYKKITRIFDCIETCDLYEF